LVNNISTFSFYPASAEYPWKKCLWCSCEHKGLINRISRQNSILHKDPAEAVLWIELMQINPLLINTSTKYMPFWLSIW